jgi:hypothetical protein
MNAPTYKYVSATRGPHTLRKLQYTYHPIAFLLLLEIYEH